MLAAVSFGREAAKIGRLSAVDARAARTCATGGLWPTTGPVVVRLRDGFQRQQASAARRRRLGALPAQPLQSSRSRSE